MALILLRPPRLLFGGGGYETPAGDEAVVASTSTRRTLKIDHVNGAGVLLLSVPNRTLCDLITLLAAAGETSNESSYCISWIFTPLL